MNDETKRFAVQMALNHWLVRVTCRRDEARMRRLADAVWYTCGDVMQQSRVEVGDRETLRGIAQYRLQNRDDYRDIVGFIPVWLLPILLKLIIGLLIDFWIQAREP